MREESGIEVYIDSEINAMHDMDRFAAQIAAVDLVISVDNSTVHVAGALGKATWVFVPSAADWRWLTPEHTDTIWYRSLTLLRQEPQSDWAPQIKAAADQLRTYSQSQIDEERQALYLRCAQQSYEFGDANTAELYFRQILARDRDHHPSLAGLGRVALRSFASRDRERPKACRLLSGFGEGIDWGRPPGSSACGRPSSHRD